MVPIGRIISLGLLVAALGLGAASQEPKTRDPSQHRPESAIKVDTKAQAEKPAAKPPTAVTQPAPQASIGDPSPQRHDADHKGEGPKWTDTVQAVSAGIVMLFTLALTIVAILQHKMESALAADADQQRADVKASIAEATRAATAMETMAEAAQRSANSASTVQRPWIKVTVGKPRPAYVKEGRLYVHVPIRFTNVGMTPANGFSMAIGCDAYPGSGKIPLDQIMKWSNRKVEKPAVTQDIIYPNDPYEVEPAFSILVDEIAADQMDRFFIAVTFEVKYFWAGGNGNVGLAGTVRPAGRGSTNFNLGGFAENSSVSAVFTGLDSWTR